MTPSLGEYARQHAIHWLPGVANASNVMTALEYDVQRMKFFPASLAGGIPMLKQFASVFPNVQFCPTGGIDEHNLHEYAALGSVFAIGGSWLTPKELIAAKDWKGITSIAKRSMSLLHSKAA